MLLSYVHNYVKIYLKTSMPFAINLILFTIMLMLHNIVTLYAHLVTAPLYPNDLL